MKYFIDITLIPDAEANFGFIWQKVYRQIHLSLVENKTTDGNSAIAVSFPEYGNGVFPLGNKLRLLAPNPAILTTVDVPKWLNRLNDYTHCTSIKEVPLSVANFARFSRKQFKTNIDRLARRRAKRKNEPFEQALKHLYASFKYQESKLPFVNMDSLSKKERFRLFIEKEMVEQEEFGEFTCYGLSKGATVPWFE